MSIHLDRYAQQTTVAIDRSLALEKLSRIETVLTSRFDELDDARRYDLELSAHKYYQWYQSQTSFGRLCAKEIPKTYHRIRLAIHPFEDYVPPEILNSILSLLNLNDLQNACLVNRQWYNWSCVAQLDLAKRFGYSGSCHVEGGKYVHSLILGFRSLTRFWQMPNFFSLRFGEVDTESRLMKLKRKLTQCSHVLFFKALESACEKGDHHAVETLLFLGLDPNIRLKYGYPIQLAARKGHVSVIEVLIRHPKILVDQTRYPSNWTALFDLMLLSKGNEYIEVIKKLIRAGADPCNAPSPFSSMSLAISSKKLEIFIAMLELINDLGDHCKYILEEFLLVYKCLPEERLLAIVQVMVGKGAQVRVVYPVVSVIGLGYQNLISFFTTCKPQVDLVGQHYCNLELAKLMISEPKSKVIAIVTELRKWGVELNHDNLKYYQEVVDPVGAEI